MPKKRKKKREHKPDIYFDTLHHHKKEKICCKFPTFAVIILVVGFLWLLSDFDIIQIDIPWIPIILIIIAIGLIFNQYKKQR